MVTNLPYKQLYLANSKSNKNLQKVNRIIDFNTNFYKRLYQGCKFKRNPIKSPLRYPGGKSKALRFIIPVLTEYDELREIFVGGGSVFIELKQRFPNKRYVINDINTDLFFFWKMCKENLDNLIVEIKNLKAKYSYGKDLFLNLNNENEGSDLYKAARYFILNRISFSGLVGAGGFSQESYSKRFNEPSLDRLIMLKDLMDNIIVTNEPYENVLHKTGNNVLIFMDPPYMSASKSRLYGKRGILHTNFDTRKFVEEVKKCKHNWLITLDDSQAVRKKFKFANVYKWQLQYAMNNYKQKTALKGRELFISNYDLTLTLNKSKYIKVEVQK